MKHWLSVIFTLLLAFPGFAHLSSWKVHGPDISGGYSGMQGAGGLELTVRESDGALRGSLSDYHGNTVGTFDGQGNLSWVETRVNGYGPVLGMEAPVLSPGVEVAEAALWRGQRIDPTGLYWLGERYYEPVSGRFLSPDPLGHAASRGLYDFCGGDPQNRFDADGRLGKAVSSAFSSMGSSLGGSGSLGTTWFDAGMGKYLDDIRYAYSSSGQAMQAYHQTRFTFDTPGKGLSLERGVSTMVNMIPVVGGLKMWGEMNARKDFLTGEKMGNEYLTAAGIALNFIGAGAMAKPAASVFNFERQAAALSGESRFLAQGFNQVRAQYLAQPYSGMGHHFLRREWGLPQVITDSRFSVLRPRNITRGEFYELHYKVDPTFYGAAFPRSIGGSWSGNAIGLEKYGLFGRMWYGSGAGAFWYFNRSN